MRIYIRYLSVNKVNMLSKLILHLSFLLLIQYGKVESTRICIFSVVPSSMSYRSGYGALIDALVDRGDEVTLFSLMPHYSGRNNTSIKFVSSKLATSHTNTFYEFISPLEWRSRGNQYVIWDMYAVLTLDVCALMLQDKEIHEWIASAGQYDLFIVDSEWNECGIGFSHIFKSKLILFNFHSNLHSSDLDGVGGAVETSWIPDAQYDVSVPMTYFQRIRSTFRAIRWHIYRNSFTFYQTRKFFRKYLQLPDFPSIREIRENTSLVLANTHFSEEYARSIPPVIVPVGGVHIKENNAINNKYLEKLPKSNANGFILVNIGCSSDTVRNLRNDTLHNIFRAMEAARDLANFVFVWNAQLRDIKTTFSVPKNVFLLGKCNPDVVSLLGHSEIKGFITHGDVLDVQEAIHHAVPLILLPVAFDQDANVERLVRLGRGIGLEIRNLLESELYDAIHSIIANETYKINIKKASLNFRDRQVKPLDSALWWIDYVLRKSDTSHLKPLGLFQPWFVRRSLDVWLPIFSLVGVAILIVFMLVAVRFEILVVTKSQISPVPNDRVRLSESGNVVRRSERINGTKIE